ncbi:Ubiquitin-conjugating enzyme E2 22-like protein [Drosera capensis]
MTGLCNAGLSLVSILDNATNENLPPNVVKQLAKELKNLDETPPEGIKVGVNDDDFSTIYADIDGPGIKVGVNDDDFSTIYADIDGPGKEIDLIGLGRVELCYSFVNAGAHSKVFLQKIQSCLCRAHWDL